MEALDILNKIKDEIVFYNDIGTKKQREIDTAIEELEELIKRNEQLEAVNKNYGDTIIALRSKVKELEEPNSCTSCIYFQNQIDEYEIACDFICGFFDMKSQRYCGAYVGKDKQ